MNRAGIPLGLEGDQLRRICKSRALMKVECVIGFAFG